MTVADLKARFPALAALVGTGALALTLYALSGQPAQTPAEVERVCNLPAIIPAAWLGLLEIPQPTQPDGTGTGTCLLPAQAEDAFRKLRIAAAILPKWRAASMTSGQCAAAIVATEFAAPGVGGTSAGAERGEPLVVVCGPAPSVASTRKIESLARLPGTSAVVVSTLGPVARPAALTGVTLRWWPRGEYPAAVTALFPCACRPRSDVAGGCKVGGAAAPFGEELPAGTWSGPCVRKQCGESEITAQALGLNYSMPAACM